MSLPTIVTLAIDETQVLVERVFDETPPVWAPHEDRTPAYYAHHARFTKGSLRLPSTNGSDPQRCFDVPCERNGIYAHAVLPKAPPFSAQNVRYEWHALSDLEVIASHNDKTLLMFENEQDRNALLAYARAQAGSSSTSSPTSQMKTF